MTTKFVMNDTFITSHEYKFYTALVNNMLLWRQVGFSQEPPSVYISDMYGNVGY